VFDVLSFVDEIYESPLPRREQMVRRQLSVNGMTLDLHLSAAYGHNISASSPLVSGLTSRSDDRVFLRGLLGEPGSDALRAGRIGVGFCEICLDSSCGNLAAAMLTLSPTEVLWSEIGLEEEHFGELVPRFRGVFGSCLNRSIPPAEWWTPDPVEPPLRFAFERTAYVATIEAEIARNSPRS
jgi:hypothetical protein